MMQQNSRGTMQSANHNDVMNIDAIEGAKVRGVSKDGVGNFGG